MFCLVAGMMLSSACAKEIQHENKGNAMKNETHPGTVTMITVFEESSKEVPVEEVPETSRFVYFIDDVETSDPESATRAVPIVEVRMFSLDDEGNLVPPDQATTIRIKEYGPEGEFLRTTRMVRD